MTGPRASLVCGLLAASLAAGGAAAGMKVEERAGPAADPIKPYTTSRALVVGNDAYRHPWPRLANAATDARLVAGALRAKGFAVTLKTDLEGGALKGVIESFFATHGGDADGRLLVWFSGHGLEGGGEGYLVPVDAPAPDAGVQFRFTAVALRRIEEYLRLVDSRHVLVVLDAAVGPSILHSARALPPPPLTNEAMRPARQVLVSGDRGQTVADDGRFRDLFVAALGGQDRADANDDGDLAARELGRYLSDRVAVATRGRQTPRYGVLPGDASAMGDFVFTLTVPRRHFIVSAAASVDAETLTRSLNAYHAEVSAMKSLAGRLFRVSLASGRTDSDLVAVLLGVPGVRSAEADATVTPRAP